MMALGRKDLPNRSIDEQSAVRRATGFTVEIKTQNLNISKETQAKHDAPQRWLRLEL